MPLSTPRLPRGLICDIPKGKRDTDIVYVKGTKTMWGPIEKNPLPKSRITRWVFWQDLIVARRASSIDPIILLLVLYSDLRLLLELSPGMLYTILSSAFFHRLGIFEERTDPLREPSLTEDLQLFTLDKMIKKKKKICQLPLHAGQLCIILRYSKSKINRHLH